MLQGKISGQRLSLQIPYIVAGTIDYLTARFCFETPDWDGMQKWAHFSCGDTVYDIELIDDRIEKDKHLNLSAGEWKIWLHGSEYVDGELVERITTNEKYITVLPTGTTDTDNPFPSATPSAIEQIEAHIGDMSTLQTENKATIVAAINELFENSGNVSAEDVIAILEQYLEEHPQGGDVQTVNGVSPDENGNIAIEVGGKQVQPDWAQNDPTQPDHILNRTHWVEPGSVTEILPETSLTYSEDMGGFVLTDALSLEAEVKYTVKWNGAEFVCVGQTVNIEGMTLVALGDVGLMMGGASTGEPFVIVEYPPEITAEAGMAVVIVPIDGSTVVTISIIGGKGDVYHKLDNNFLDLAWLPTIDVAETEAAPETMVIIDTAFETNPTDIAYTTIPEDTETVVTWNGAKYNCAVKVVNVGEEVGYIFYIGNIGMLGDGVYGADTGEPFLFCVMSVEDSYAVVANAPGEYTYSINKLDKVYNTIPEEFLGNNTGDVLDIDLYEMGMAEVVASSSVNYSFDAAEVLYALQTGKRVTVSFRLCINHVSGGITSTPTPKIVLTASGGGRLTTGYGSSIECLDSGIEAATITSVYLFHSGVTVTAYRLADLIDARIATAFTDGDEVSY